MGTAPAAARRLFRLDLGTALQTATNSTTRKTRDAGSKIFALWTVFCHAHGTNAALSDIPGSEDRLCYMLVFALRFRLKDSTRPHREYGKTDRKTG